MYLYHWLYWYTILILLVLVSLLHGYSTLLLHVLVAWIHLRTCFDCFLYSCCNGLVFMLLGYSRWVYLVYTWDHGLKQFPGCWPGPSAKRGAWNGKRELMELYTIGSQHYHTLQWDKLWIQYIHPIRPYQPSSLPHPHAIFIIFKLHSITWTRTVHGTCNMITRHEFYW